MLGVFAEFETNLRRERQLEGNAALFRFGDLSRARPALSARVGIGRAPNDGCLAPSSSIKLLATSFHRVIQPKSHRSDRRSIALSLQAAFGIIGGPRAIHRSASQDAEKPE
jgi:hypothetical protein